MALRILAHRYDVDSAVWTHSTINDRSRRNANLRSDLPTRDIIRWRFTGFEQLSMPKLLATVRVKRIETVMLSGHKEDISQSLIRDPQIGYVEWLGINLSVNLNRKELAKCFGIYVL